MIAFMQDSPPVHCSYPKLGVGLWDFTAAYLKDASENSYPPASRALAEKNGVSERIPPPQDRGQGVRPQARTHAPCHESRAQHCSFAAAEH